MLEKEFVPHEEALALKELGFNEHCLASYFHAGKRLHITEYISHGEHTTLAPTFSQAFRFFRKMGLDQKIERESEGLYIGFYWNGVVWEQAGAGSYEEAEFACLRELIEIQGGNK